MDIVKRFGFSNESGNCVRSFKWHDQFANVRSLQQMLETFENLSSIDIHCHANVNDFQPNRKEMPALKVMNLLGDDVNILKNFAGAGNLVDLNLNFYEPLQPNPENAEALVEFLGRQKLLKKLKIKGYAIRLLFSNHFQFNFQLNSLFIDLKKDDVRKYNDSNYIT